MCSSQLRRSSYRRSSWTRPHTHTTPTMATALHLCILYTVYCIHKWKFDFVKNLTRAGQFIPGDRPARGLHNIYIVNPLVDIKKERLTLSLRGYFRFALAHFRIARHLFGFAFRVLARLFRFGFARHLVVLRHRVPIIWGHTLVRTCGDFKGDNEEVLVALAPYYR